MAVAGARRHPTASALQDSKLITTHAESLMPRHRVIALVLLLAAACGGGTESDGPRVTASDSAGVRVLTLRGDLDSLPVLQVADTTTLRGAPEDIFGNNPSGAIPLSDGRTVLSDGQNFAVFSSDGDFKGPFVRRGQGPGEIQALSAWWFTTGDSLWINDFSTRRLSLFAPSLEFVRSVSLPIGEAAYSVIALGELGRDTVAIRSAQVANAPPMAAGRRENFYALGLWMLDPDSIARGRERLFSESVVGESPTGRGLVFIAPPMSPTGQWQLLGRCTIFGYADQWSFEILEPGGVETYQTAGLIRAPNSRAATVTPEAREEFITASMAGGLGSSQFASAFEKLLREQQFPDSMPLFARLLTGRDGAVWVQRYRGATLDREDAWTVVDAGNARAWRFTLPPRTRLLGVDRGRALIAVRDEDDLETQHWLRLPELDDVALPAACQRNDAPN